MESTIRPRGGYRSGSGRKPGIASIKAEEARKYMVERIAAELGPILTGQIEMAKGAYYEETNLEGQRTIYRQLPDSKVASYLLNQLVGRPKETVDLNVKPVFSLRELAQRALKIQAKENLPTYQLGQE